MITKQKRFIGAQPFSDHEALLFFGRERQTDALYELSMTQSAWGLFGKASSGKTSLLRAGFVPLLRKSGLFEVIYIDFSEIKQSNLTEFLNANIPIPPKDTSFYDKVLSKSNSVWKTIKKYRQKTGTSRHIVLIADGFEQLLNFDKLQRQDFFNELNYLLKSEIPRKIQSEIDEFTQQFPDMLTESATEHLEKPADVRICFSMREEHTERLREELEVFFRINTEKSVYLTPFTRSEARMVLEKIISFEPTNPQYVKFETPAFSVNDESIEELSAMIISESKRIEPYDLQFIGQYLEHTALQAHLTQLSPDSFSSDIKSLSEFQKYLWINNYGQTEADNAVLKKYCTENQSNKLPSGEDSRAEIFRKTLDESGKTEFELYSDFACKLLKFNKEDTVVSAKSSVVKSPKNRIMRILYVLFPVLIISLFLWQYSNRKIKNALHLSESNLYAAYAFQNIETDPTLSFRFAEKAYRLNANNPAAYSALLNAYYKSEVFYSLDASVDSAAQFSTLAPDGSMFASVAEVISGKQYTLQVKSSDNRLLFEYQHFARIIFVEISSDTALILFGDAEGMLTVLDNSGKKQASFKAHDGMIWNAKLLADKQTVLTSGADFAINLFDLDGTKRGNLPTHDFDAYAIAASPDGKFLATGVEHIDLCSATGTLIKRVHISFNNTYYEPLIQHLEFSEDSKKLLAVINDLKGQNHTIRVFDIGGNETALLREHSDWINTAHFSKDGAKILSVSRDRTARLQDIENQSTEIVKGHTANVNDARFLKQNQNKVITLSDDKTVRTWTFGRLLNPLATIPGINQTKFSSDGFGIIAASDTLAFWCDIAGDVKARYSGNGTQITAIDLTLDKQLVATASKDKRIRINFQNGKTSLIYTPDSVFASDVCFRPDSAVLVSGGSDGKLIFRNLTDTLPFKFVETNSPIRALCFSPDGKFLLTAQGNGTAILRTAWGAPLRTFTGHTKDVMSVAFSPDGQFVATTSKDKSARLWTTEGKLIYVFSDFSNPVNSAEFSPDGNYLLTASNDGYVKLYLLNGQEIARFKHHGKVLQSTFSPDGNYILSVVKKDNVQTADLQVISPKKILELTNETKIFGDFYRLPER